MKGAWKYFTRNPSHRLRWIRGRNLPPNQSQRRRALNFTEASGRPWIRFEGSPLETRLTVLKGPTGRGRKPGRQVEPERPAGQNLPIVPFH